MSGLFDLAFTLRSSNYQGQHTPQVEWIEAHSAEIKPITVQAFVQGAIIECFINRQFAFTCRAYDYSKGDLSLEVAGGQMKILDLTVKTLPRQSP